MPLPLLPLALGGASLFGGLFGNRGHKSTQASTTSQAVSPEASGFSALLMDLIKQRLQTGTDLSGYKAQGIQDINRTYDSAQTGLNADLTARGLSDSPAAIAPTSRLQSGRAGSIAQLINSLPMLQREQQNQDLSAGAQLYGMQPRTTMSTGTFQQPGNMTAGGIGSLSSMLAYLFGSGAFGGPKAPGGMFANVPFGGAAPR
jgi:hypothetical protein